MIWEWANVHITFHIYTEAVIIMLKFCQITGHHFHQIGRNWQIFGQCLMSIQLYNTIHLCGTYMYTSLHTAVLPKSHGCSQSQFLDHDSIQFPSTVHGNKLCKNGTMNRTCQQQIQNVHVLEGLKLQLVLQILCTYSLKRRLSKDNDCLVQRTVWFHAFCSVQVWTTLRTK